MINEWVVAYHVEFADHNDGKLCSISTFEVFRGSEQECKRIRDHSVAPTTVENRKIVSFKPIIGPARYWDELFA